MAATGRLKMKQTPVDSWSIRERMSLGCSVLRSGDQNWVSVSRAIKPYGEPNRPPEWFSQKNCALQYSDLLEKVQTPKRKSGGTETPGDQIVRKLTIERIEELKKIVQEEQQKYKKLKREIEAIKAGQNDDRIKEYWQEIQKDKKAAEEAAAAVIQKVAEEAKLRAETPVKPPGKPVAYPNKSRKLSPNLRVKVGLCPDQDDSTSDSLPDSISVKTEDESSNLSVPSTSSTPQPPPATEDRPKTTPQSPLLSSLLASRQDLSHLLQPQQQQQLQQQLQQHLLHSPKGQSQQQQMPQQQVATQPNEEMQPLPPTVIGTPIKQEPIEVDTPSPVMTPPSLQVPTQEPAPNTPVPATVSLLASSSTITIPPVVTSSPIPVSTSSVVVTKSEVPSSPAIGAPTLSRLLGTPPATCTSPSVLEAQKPLVSKSAPSSEKEGKDLEAKSDPIPSERKSESEKKKDHTHTKDKAREGTKNTKLKVDVEGEKKPTEKKKDPKSKKEKLDSDMDTSSEKGTKVKEPGPSEPEIIPEQKQKSPEKQNEKIEQEETREIPDDVPKVPECPVKKELQLEMELDTASASGDGTPTTPVKGTPSILDEEPPSPASSIRSNETDGGGSSTTTRGRPRGRSRGSYSRGRRSSRVSKTRMEGKKDKDLETGSKPSEAESSDDEAHMPESDDASMMPRRTLSISESVPNSPASLSQCSDTEDEKAYKVWKKSIMLVWRSAANHKYANVFLHPVTEEIAPGYRSIVYRPMDLYTIKKHIENAVIRTTAEFQRDMMLMFTNAIMYNNSDHNVYHMAVEMYNDVMMHIEQYVNTQMMVNAETKILRASRRSEAASSDKEDDSKKRRVSDDKDGGKAKKRKL